MARFERWLAPSAAFELYLEVGADVAYPDAGRHRRATVKAKRALRARRRSGALLRGGGLLFDAWVEPRARTSRSWRVTCRPGVIRMPAFPGFPRPSAATPSSPRCRLRVIRRYRRRRVATLIARSFTDAQP